MIRVVLGPPVDALPDFGHRCAPVLQLLFAELPDADMRLFVLLLSLDRIEVRAELRQPFQLDRCHLLLTVENVVHHLVNVRGLLLVVSECNDTGPPQVLEGYFYALSLLLLDL